MSKIIPSLEAARLFEAMFNATFAAWGIRLHVDMTSNGCGRIDVAGWSILYCAGLDEAGEYFDYHAIHRMTDDRHVRFRTDGTRARLPSVASMRMSSEDADEDRRLEDAWRTRTRSICSVLAEKFRAIPQECGHDLTAHGRSADGNGRPG